MASCELCKRKVQKLFLGKVKGGYVKDAKGKKHLLCFECQKKFQTKKEQLEQLGK